MLGVMGASYYFKTNKNKDGDKILKIAENCGLYKGEEKIRIYRRSYNKNRKYTEYAIKIPLGLELQDFLDKYGKFKDGLNNRSVRRIELSQLKTLKFDHTIIKQIQNMLDYRLMLNKEIEMDFDGMLLLRVYDEGLQTRYDLTEEIMDSCKPWNVALGESLTGRLYHDFENGPMVLIGGATDMGKSTILNVITNTLLYNHPEDISFTFIDLKGGLEFGAYEHIKQKKNFATNASEALTALENVQKEMSEIFDTLRRTEKKSVKELGNTKRHFVIIDEAAELTSDGEVDPDVKKIKIQCETIIKDIARRGRASGIRLLYCTQYPTTETVSSQVKRNLITRISLLVDTSTASKVVLDQTGAESLPDVKGRAIYKKTKSKVMQSYFIEENLIESIIKPHINIRKGEETNVSHQREKTRTGRNYTTKFEET